MIFRFLFILYAASSFALSQNNADVIPWNPARRLTWDDFRGTAPETARNAALTSSSILVNFNYNNRTLHYQITCHFDRNKSWGRVKNEHILAHEQGHFDITEIYARKLYKNLKAYRFSPSTVSTDIRDIYQQAVNELQTVQNEYDAETDHSRNFPQQKAWLEKIQDELESSSDYAGYAKGI
jgi:hypothetical protein